MHRNKTRESPTFCVALLRSCSHWYEIIFHCTITLQCLYVCLCAGGRWGLQFRPESQRGQYHNRTSSGVCKDGWVDGWMGGWMGML